MLRHIPQTDGFRWIHFLLTAILLPVLWHYNGVHVDMQAHIADNGEGLAEVRGSRFTSADGLEVWIEIGKIRAEIAALPAGDLRAKLDKVEDQLSETNQRLARLEALLEDGLGATRGGNNGIR